MGSSLDRRIRHADQLRQLAGFITSASYSDLDAQTIALTKNFIMDTIAVGVAGSSYDATDKALAAAKYWGEGSARVIAHKGVSLPAASAAFVNGMQVHCLEWDGLHEPTVVIALCAPMGALLAEIESRTISGKELINALVIAVEIAVFFGGNQSVGPRFFRPSIVGALAATAVIAKLRDFDSDRTMQAMGLAYSQISGTMQAHWEGSMALPMQVGVASRTAVFAADMAAAGMTGPIDFISGEFSFFRLFEAKVDIDERFAALVAAPKILEVAHKPFPAGRGTQAALTMWTELTQQRDIAVDQIKQIRVQVPPLIELLVGRPIEANMTPSYARLCLRFVLPLLIIEGRVNPKQFNPSVFTRDDIVSLSKRVIIEGDGNPDKNALGPQTMIIELNDGNQLSGFCEHPLGSPANPLSQRACNSKVMDCFELANNAYDAIVFIESCQTLETIDDCKQLLDLVC